MADTWTNERVKTRPYQSNYASILDPPLKYEETPRDVQG